MFSGTNAPCVAGSAGAFVEGSRLPFAWGHFSTFIEGVESDLNN